MSVSTSPCLLLLDPGDDSIVADTCVMAEKSGRYRRTLVGNRAARVLSISYPTIPFQDVAVSPPITHIFAQWVNIRSVGILRAGRGRAFRRRDFC